MIFLTRMDKQSFFINPDHIVSIEETPDTVITLFNGNHFIVKEPAQVIINRIVAFRSRIIRRSGAPAGKKYLSKSRQRLFRSATLNREEQYPLNRKEKISAPFHIRDH